MAAEDESLSEELREDAAARATEIAKDPETLHGFDRERETIELTKTTMSERETTETETETETEKQLIGEYATPDAPARVRDITEDGGEGVALFVRDKRADAVHVAATGQTIAEHNPEHPEDAPVVGVVFKGALRERYEDRWEEWLTEEPEWLVFRAGNDGMKVYEYPVTRLEWGEDAGAYGCANCTTIHHELDLPSEVRESRVCPECGEPALVTGAEVSAGEELSE